MKEKIIFTLLYKWKYLIAIFQSKFIKKEKKSDFKTITYVAREADKDWIFGAKVNRLASFSGLDSTPYFHDRLRDLPDSDGYFFVFHQYFYRAIRHNPKILNKKNWNLKIKSHVLCLQKMVFFSLLQIKKAVSIYSSLTDPNALIRSRPLLILV